MGERPVLVLASRSPRRAQLLEQIGLGFRAVPADIPEQRAPDESPRAYVSRVAREKAALVLAQQREPAWVLGADTEVVLGDEVLGKPADGASAAAMLARLAGRRHEVVSVVWLLGPDTARSAESVSQVTMAALDAQTIAAYVASGEPMGKAGGYAIQGRAAAFISHLQGSYSGVMGLPLHETAALLRDCGIV